jgi:hypothetical protein
MPFLSRNPGTLRCLDGYHVTSKVPAEHSAVRRFCALAAVGVLFLVGTTIGQTPPSAINPGTPWPATDALGRVLPTTPPSGEGESTSSVRANRCVGIFYFLWHDQMSPELPNDLAKILAQDPDILRNPDSPLWGKPGHYYWAQPLYGYYHAADPWVLRRHANLLTDAGIDTVIFDTTNRRTYRDVYMKLCEVWTQIRREGGRTPQICFMVNTEAGETAQELYKDLYKPMLFPELWFQWQGKPLLICDPAKAAPNVKQFFTLRKAHWPFTLVNTHNEWHWESTYPQVFSYDQDAAMPEQLNVAVAQNLRVSDGKVTNMSSGDARGRSFHDGKKDLSPGAVDRGHNFEEQWRRALELDPPFVMVTGWNEWIAGRFSRPGQPVVFVDQFDQEYSRDIEPVSGLHNDNYYYQLVANVRRYKGTPALPAASAPKTFDPAAGFAQWREVAPAFVDHAFDNDHRDFGLGARHYRNNSGRNDLMVMKVARDRANVYFYAQTRERLTSTTDQNWMWLLVDSDRDAKTGWQGYDFLLNRTIHGDEASIERNTGGWNWEKTGNAVLRSKGNELMVSAPREALGLAKVDGVSLDFKWWDNARKPGDVMDVYLSGDVAPDGRFNFRYTANATTAGELAK